MNLANRAKFVASRGGLLLKKHSPDILLGVGIVGMVGAAVMAVKATRKFDEVAEENRELIEAAQGVIYEGQTNMITEKEANQQVGLLYIRAGMNWVKLYGPAVAIGTASIVSIVAGHVQTRQRAASVMAAYSLLDQSFKRYRGNVIEQLGVEKDAEFRFGKPDKKAYEEIDEVTGRKKKTKYDAYACPENEYSFLFDEYNTNWRNEHHLNMFFLKSVQNYMNDKLMVQGHVFLNEVYDELGHPRTKAGAVVGWVLNSEEGDGIIDLGLYSPINQAFAEGKDPSCIIDPNVDGVIYDLL